MARYDEHVPFLERLIDDEREALLAIAARRRVPAHRVLFSQGDEAHCIWVLLGGHIKLSVSTADGFELVLDMLGPGTLLGELAFMDRCPRSATGTTIEPTEIAAIPFSALESYLRTHDRITGLLIGQVCACLRRSDLRLLEFATSDALGRVCARIADLADEVGSPTGGLYMVALPVTQSELASWTCISREAVVRSLRTLRKLGWLDNDGSVFTIFDLPAIRARAGR